MRPMRLRSYHHLRGILTLLPLTAFLLLGGCAELEAQRTQLAEQDRTIRKLSDENKQFQDAYYKIKEQLENQDSQTSKNIEKMTRDLEQARNTRTQKEKELGDQLRSRTLESEAFKKESLDQRVLLEAQAAQLQQAVQAANAERDATAAKLKQAEDQLRAEQARATDLGQQVNQLEADAKTAAEQLAALKNDLTARDAALKTAQDALSTEQQARAAAEQQRDEAQQKLAAGGKALEEAQARLADLKKQSESAATAQADLEQARKDNDTLTKEVAALKGQLSDQRNKPSAPVSLADDPELKGRVAAIEDQLKAVKGVRVRLDGHGLRVIIPEALLFEQGKATLSSKAGAVLGPLAKALGETGSRPVLVEGHTDNQPPQEPYADNWTLGFARADRVREYLMQDGGISAARLTALSRAEFAPLTGNDTTEGRRQNRRVEVVVGAKNSD